MSSPPTIPSGAVFSMLKDEVRDLLNVSTETYGTHDGSKRYPEELIEDALMRADEKVVGWFLAQPNHPRRADFMTEASVGHAARIPAHIGPIGAVTINTKAAEVWPASEIEMLRTNRLGLVGVGRRYAVEGEKLFFVDEDGASTAQVDLADYNAITGVIQSPPEYLNAVIACALSMIFGKDAASSQLPAAQHYLAVEQAALQLVGDDQPVPVVQPYRG